MDVLIMWCHVKETGESFFIPLVEKSAKNQTFIDFKYIMLYDLLSKMDQNIEVMIWMFVKYVNYTLPQLIEQFKIMNLAFQSIKKFVSLVFQVNCL